MSLVINSNTASLEAQRNIASTQYKLGLNFQRLSSGFRINTAQDDASGLAILESMRTQIRGYSIAERNANSAISMTQVAEGAVGQVISIIGRMRDLAVQASNGDLTSTDRGYLNTEFAQLRSEVDRLTTATKFNSRELLNTTSTSFDFQIGIGTESENKISVTFGAVTSSDLGISTSVLSGTNAANAQSAITALDLALGTANTRRADFGAAMNRLQMAVAHLKSMHTNTSAAASRLGDVDVAEETAMLARNQVLAQAGAAVLAQANQSPQIALSLLR